MKRKTMVVCLVLLSFVLAVYANAEVIGNKRTAVLSVPGII